MAGLLRKKLLFWCWNQDQVPTTTNNATNGQQQSAAASGCDNVTSSSPASSTTPAAAAAAAVGSCSSSSPGASSASKGFAALRGKVEKEQEKINKKIEKQIKKDKQKYKSQHRIQLVGLEHSGKSTIIKQMMLTNNHLEISDAVRAQKRCELLSILDETLKEILRALPKRGLRTATADNESKKRWLLYEEGVTRDRDRGQRLSDLEPKKYFDVMETLWRDPNVQRCYKLLQYEGKLMENIQFFFERLSHLRSTDYLPGDREILRCYEPTAGIREAAVKFEQSMFKLIEVSGRQTGSKWIQYSNDSLAIAFVVDTSAYDLMSDPQNSRTLLQETLLYFQSIWNHPGLLQKSVILFLNKQDILSEKILSGESPLQNFFPEFQLYTLPANTYEELQNGANVEELRARYFIRDLFLQVAHTSADCNHQCYPLFTTAVEMDQDFGRFIGECCRDILQRVHLKMHEIL